MLNCSRNNTQRLDSVLLVVLVCLAITIGCRRENSSTTKSSKQSAPTQRYRYITASARQSDANDSTISFPQNLPIDPRAIVIGLDADMTQNSAAAGEAIRRGIILAIDEINERGGILDRPLQLQVKDHRGNPSRGVDNLLEFASLKNLVAVVGGLHTPVAIEELATIHEQQLIYLGPWAAGTPLVSNNYLPNFVFRVSVRDEFAGEFLINSAEARGHRRLGLLLERTAWGTSNLNTMQRVLRSLGRSEIGVEWFHWAEPSLEKQIERLLSKNADAILLVANAPEGATAVTEMASLARERRVPIYSHWGILGGNFLSAVGSNIKEVDFFFLQTFSFSNPRHEDRTTALCALYDQRFNPRVPLPEVTSYVGTVHAYELIHMLAAAISECGSCDRRKVRDTLESLPHHKGVIRDYKPPFTATNHDALSISDLQLMRFGAAGEADYVSSGLIAPETVMQ